MVVERIEHDPARTIEFLEAENFEVQQDDGGGYRVAGTMAGKPVVFLVPDADALYYLWLGWLADATMSAIAPVIEAMPPLLRVLPGPAAGVAQDRTVPSRLCYSSKASERADPPVMGGPKLQDGRGDGPIIVDMSRTDRRLDDCRRMGWELYLCAGHAKVVGAGQQALLERDSHMYVSGYLDGLMDGLEELPGSQRLPDKRSDHTAVRRSGRSPTAVHGLGDRRTVC